MEVVRVLLLVEDSDLEGEIENYGEESDTDAFIRAEERERDSETEQSDIRDDLGEKEDMSYFLEFQKRKN